MFYGPPGTGKTSTILAVAKQLYAPKEFNSMVLEVNYSVDSVYIKLKNCLYSTYNIFILYIYIYACLIKVNLWQ